MKELQYFYSNFHQLLVEDFFTGCNFSGTSGLPRVQAENLSAASGKGLGQSNEDTGMREMAEAQ